MSPTSAFRERVKTVRTYAGDDDRPLRGYLALGTAYLAATAMVLRRASRAPRSRRLTPTDLATFALASQRLSRTLTKESIASPLRAPFTRFDSAGNASEVNEEVVVDGTHRPYAHAVGELLTCPFCMAQWTSTVLVAAHLLAPRPTRTMVAILDIAAVANVLHLAYAALAEKVEG